MRFINKKVVISILCLIEFCFLFLSFKSFGNRNELLDDVTTKEKDNNLFAIMVENSNGEYTSFTGNSFPTDMIYNEELSGCIDMNGIKLENSLTYENNMATIETNKTAYCYLYFDIDYSDNVYNKMISDYTNNNGVNLLTENNKNIYYYTGNVTNNNIIYAGFCWKMVRTTETRGVKLIFNGEINNGSCNNTGTSSHIETDGTKFNDFVDPSPAYAGYMYNKIYTADSKSMTSNTSSYKYGNSISWNGEKYTLVNTISGTWSSKYSLLNNYHYTCFSTSGTCTNVYYIYYGDSDQAKYITLTDGKTVSDALNEMLYASDVNTTNSLIKDKIDTWYEGNIKEKKDSNNKLYSDYLENTIYCNNREIILLNGWNPNGGYITEYNSMYFNSDSLECENKTDQFTLKVESGGKESYGNNALDYPIALLTYKEASLATPFGYLNNGSSYWLLSPHLFSAYVSNNWVALSGVLDYYAVSISSGYGVRPVVSLSKEVRITLGTGEINNPYIIELTQ